MSIEAMKQAVVYFEHMVRTLKLRDESEPSQLLFKLRQAIEQAEKQEPVAWLYQEGLEALKQGRCWTAYGTKQDDLCNVPVYLGEKK